MTRGAAEGDAAWEPPRPSDAVVPWLLLLGGFVFVLGWFLGVGLLWTSGTWRRRDKLLGTLVLPGGLLPAALLDTLPGSTTTCTGGNSNGHPLPQVCSTTGFALPPAVGIAILLCTLLAPMLTAIHLERMRRRARPGPPPARTASGYPS